MLAVTISVDHRIISALSIHQRGVKAADCHLKLLTPATLVSGRVYIGVGIYDEHSGRSDDFTSLIERLDLHTVLGRGL